MAAALSLAGVGTASAHGHDHGGKGGGHCDRNVPVKYSTDGGQHWTRGDTIGNAPKSIVVKLDRNVTKGCAYPISLAAYKTDGPTWESSGTQVFLGVAQTTLSHKNPKATLKVNGVDGSECNGQIDLYGNDTVYDGKSGKLPHYPDSYTPTNLIAHWNGAFKDDCGKDSGGGTPPPSGTPSTGPSDSSSPSTGPSDTSSPSTGPSDTTSPSPSTSASSGTPSTSPSSSAPAAGATAAPSGTPVAQPVSSTPTLAETGSNSSQTTTFIAAGAALVVIGAGAVVFTRRRNRGSNA